MSSPATSSTPEPPQAERRPQTVTHGGITYDDPYAWLEDDSPEAVAYQTAQDAFAQHTLQASPAFAHFNADMAGRAQGGMHTVPRYAGGRWFRLRVPEGRDLQVLEMADTPEGPGRTLIDLNAESTGEPLKFDRWQPSPDGRRLLFGWSAGGREMEQFKVMEVDTGRLLLEGIPQVRCAFACWGADSNTLYYQAFDPALSLTTGHVYRLRLGQPAPTVPEPLEVSHPLMWPVASADRRHVIVCADHLNPRPDYIRDAAADGPWQPFLQGASALFRGDILGEHYIAITSEGAPRGRLVAIPLASPQDRASWRELVPQTSAVLACVVVVGQRIALLDLVDTYARLRVLEADGSLHGEIPLPGRGLVNSFGGTMDVFNMIDSLTRGAPGELLFVYCSPSQSPGLYRAHVDTLAVDCLREPQETLDVQVHDRVATSADGARVPYHVIARRDLDVTQPRPTLLHGYGGFNVALLPGWAGTGLAAWVRAGGVLVLAHLRGGGELGPEQWHQGRLALKQNSFNDAYAIAEALIADGVTSPAQLGAVGGSNGGVMAAALAVQRPDLFRATSPQVPITDVLARGRDPITVAASLDYGDPGDTALAPSIAAWSPYQNVRDGVAYPAVLVDSGLNDPRCPPWHGRKFAAALQHASTSGRPALLRVRAGAGHGAVGEAAQALQNAEMLAFFAEQLGLRP